MSLMYQVFQDVIKYAYLVLCCTELYGAVPFSITGTAGRQAGRQAGNLSTPALMDIIRGSETYLQNFYAAKHCLWIPV